MSRLSVKHGGTVQTKENAYCTLYKTRPFWLKIHILCSGCKIWTPCEDYERCTQNKPVETYRIPSRYKDFDEP